MKLTKLVTTSAIVLATLVGSSSAALAAEYKSNGAVEFIENTDPTDPVDPTDPTVPVDPIDPTDPEGPNPGTAGPLSIDFASSVVFGKNKISNANQTYFADAQELKDGRFVPNYVQVTDTRSGNLGWTLTVQQEGQFTNATAVNKVLTGSVIKLADGAVSSSSTSPAAVAAPTITLDPSGASSLVMSAKAGSGWGTWLNYFGDVTEETIAEDEVVQKNKAITLDVPGSTPKDAVQYKTELTWTLSDTPGNV
ncbi:WxL domain-containing protein [Carnobacterium maltaromaticum]|uniref:WxL domain-containing protein n=1 Tax=Carnobacterium maltaromaticum TaxID=2751 RepID=UPI00191BCA11|nr:WxL domain-containing protein [Carnobacterium maltaromaticum]CAD5900222.1 WxL domain-containing cell surface protein [Carnobacterium maltaromaticum]